MKIDSLQEYIKREKEKETNNINSLQEFRRTKRIPRCNLREDQVEWKNRKICKAGLGHFAATQRR